MCKLFVSASRVLFRRNGEFNNCSGMRNARISADWGIRDYVRCCGCCKCLVFAYRFRFCCNHSGWFISFFFGCIFHTRKNTVPCSSLLTADCVLALSVDLGFLDLTVVLLHLLNPGSRSNYSVRLLGSVSHTLVLGNKDKRVSKS